MKHKFLQTSGESKIIPRDHSPYCEATGPIVQEGFVAARIKGFQQLEENHEGKRSHSPMIPCPVPSWLKIYEPETPPKTISTLGRNTKGGLHQSEHSSKVQTITNRASLKSEAKDEHSLERQKEKEAQSPANVIFEPQAIPPEFSEAPSDSPQGQTQRQDEGDAATLQRNLRPRRSVAEKLGSLVDRGWAGYDFLDEASDGQTLFETTSHDFMPTDARQPDIDQTFEDALAKFKHVDDVHTIQNDLPPHHPHTRLSDISTVEESLSDSPNHNLDNIQEYDIQESPTHKPQPRSRAWTLDRVKGQVLDQHEQLQQRRTLSLSQMIDHQLSDWATMDLKTTSEEEDAKETSRLSPLPASSPAPPDPERLNSSQTTHKVPNAARRPRRSASWLGKLPRNRLPFKERIPFLRNTSRKSSKASVESGDFQGSDDRPPEELDGNSFKLRSLGQRDYVGRIGESRPSNQTLANRQVVASSRQSAVETPPKVARSSALDDIEQALPQHNEIHGAPRDSPVSTTRLVDLQSKEKQHSDLGDPAPEEISRPLSGIEGFKIVAEGDKTRLPESTMAHVPMGKAADKESHGASARPPTKTLPTRPPSTLR